MANIGDFIVQTLPALSGKGNYITAKQLCGLFHSELFRAGEIPSYASEGESGAKYLLDLLTRYDMLPTEDGIVVRMVTGIEHDAPTEDEQRLCDLLKEGRKYADFIFDVDPSLGNQVVISYAAYNSKKSLTES